MVSEGWNDHDFSDDGLLSISYRLYLPVMELLDLSVTVVQLLAQQAFCLLVILVLVMSALR
jgi:hypothetical protein